MCGSVGRCVGGREECSKERERVAARHSGQEGACKREGTRSGACYMYVSARSTALPCERVSKRSAAYFQRLSLLAIGIFSAGLFIARSVVLFCAFLGNWN